MTIRLLGYFNGIDANTIVDLDTATEAGLVAAKQATTDLTGGFYRPLAAPAGVGTLSKLGRPPYEPVLGNLYGAAGNLTIASSFVVGSASLTNYPAAIGAWGPFSAVRLVFMNHQATTATVDNHIVGAGPRAWVNGTYNLNNSDINWNATAAGPVTIPAATGATAPERLRRPGMALGPELKVRSVPRAAGEPDFGTNELLFTRTQSAANNTTMPCGAAGAGFSAAYDPINEGLTAILAADPSSAADFISNVAGWTTSSARAVNPGYTVFGAVFTYDQAWTSLMGIGDSIMAGFLDGASQRTPWGFKAAARIRKSGKRVGFYNGSIPSSTIYETTIRGKQLIDLMQPSIILIASYSVNSPVGTQAEWDAQWAEATSLAAYAQSKGARPVFITPLPWVNFSNTQNGYRLKQYARVVNSGLPYVDVEALAGSAGLWANSADTTDGTHLSLIGHEKVAVLAQPVLDAMVA